MQKYSEENILQQFDEVIVLTEQMKRTILVSDFEVKTLEEFYNVRIPLLNQLAGYKSTVTGGNQDFLQQWNTRAAALVDADKELLSALGTLKNDCQEKLRDSVKRKYLLIYSKGNNHVY